MKVGKILLAICPALDDQVPLREEKGSMMSASGWDLSILRRQFEIFPDKPVQFVACLALETSYPTWFVATPEKDLLLEGKQGKMR